MEYSNPFDDPQGPFFILENRDGQHSLWPAHCAPPAGWRTAFGPAEPDACQQWLSVQSARLQPARWAQEVTDE